MTEVFQSPAYPHVRSDRFVLRISPDQRNFITFTLWCCATFTRFPGDQLLLYPLALYYVYAVWRDQRYIAAVLSRAWPALLFPAWCLLSPIWATEPVSAVKHSIYLLLTMMVCFNVGTTMSARRIMHALLLATGTIGVINLVYSVGTGADMVQGIFGQKNTMGKNMVVLWVVATATLLDPQSSPLTRCAGAGLAVLAAAMSVVSDSATAVLLVLATGMLNLTGAVFLLGGPLRPSRLALFFLIGGIVLVLACMVLPTLQTDPISAVLGHFGKDTTLTGRTVLWQYAAGQIREHPLVGVGDGGFWRYDASPLVRRIFVEFHKTNGAHFNFHNSYFEISVHQGLIGLGLVLLAIFWGLIQVLRGALTLATMPHIYFLTHSLTVLVRTTTESDFLMPFVIFHMIFWIGAVVAIRDVDSLRRATKRKARAQASGVRE